MDFYTNNLLYNTDSININRYWPSAWTTMLQFIAWTEREVCDEREIEERSYKEQECQ